jgi:hypothetical protein
MQHMPNHDQLVFDDVSTGDKFLRLVLKDLHEKLSDMKREYVRGVREQANSYMHKHFEKLETMFGALQKDGLQAELIDELQDRSANVERLIFSLIRSDTLSGLRTRPDALSRLRSKMKKLVYNQKPIDEVARAPMEGEGTSSAESPTTRIERLGFIRRAPATEIRPFGPFKLFTRFVSPFSLHHTDGIVTFLTPVRTIRGGKEFPAESSERSDRPSLSPGAHKGRETNTRTDDEEHL